MLIAYPEVTMRSVCLWLLLWQGLVAQPLVMLPKQVMVPGGQTVQFRIPGQDPKLFHWRADRGKIDESGLFTAPSEFGPCRVTANDWQDVNRMAMAEVQTVEITLRSPQELLLRPREESRILIDLTFRGGELDRKLVWTFGKRYSENSADETAPPAASAGSGVTPHDGRVDATGWVRAPSSEGNYPVEIYLAADPRIRTLTNVQVFKPRAGRINPQGEPVTVQIQPLKAEIRAGEYHSFSVSVIGVDLPQVTFSLLEGPKDGQIGPEGIFRAATPGAYRIRATSCLYPECWGEAEVVVKSSMNAVKEEEGAKVNRLGMGIAPGPKGGYVVFGGWDGSQVSREVLIHDAMAGTFEACALLQTGRARGLSVCLSDGTTLVVGGLGGPGNLPLRDAERIDAVRKVSWRVGAPRWFHIGGLLQALPGGRALLLGGCEPGGQASGAEIFESASGTFKILDEHPWPSQAASVVLEGGAVLILGGELERRPLSLVWRFDPAKNSFTPLGKLTQARSRFSATLSVDQKSILVIGGRGAQGSLATVEHLDLASGKATLSGRMTAPREGHAAILIPTGTTLVFGGGGGSRASRAMEEWNPDAGAFSIRSNLPSGAWLPKLFLNLDGGVFISGIPEDMIANATLPVTWKLWD